MSMFDVHTAGTRSTIGNKNYSVFITVESCQLFTRARTHVGNFFFRDTRVSQHNGGLIKGPLKPLNTIVMSVVRGV